jgi:hypothetical protein
MIIEDFNWKKSCFEIGLDGRLLLTGHVGESLLFNELIQLTKSMIVLILIDNFGKGRFFLFLQKRKLLNRALATALQIRLSDSLFPKFFHGWAQLSSSEKPCKRISVLNLI